MALVQLFSALVKVALETAAGAINENNEIDLFSKVEAGEVPGLCHLTFVGGTKVEEPHELVGIVTVSCTAADDGNYVQLYFLDNMGAGTSNAISDPKVGGFTISFGGSNPSVQVPLDGEAILESSWYETSSGGDTFNTIDLKEIATDPITMENCAGNIVDVVVGNYEFLSDVEYADQQITYAVVVPVLGATGVCPG